METIEVTRLIGVHCASCGCLFGLEQNMMSRLQESHKNFYCPNQHANCYFGETEADRFKRQMEEQRERANRERDARLREEHTKNVALGKLRASNARIKAGVCPCCHRTIAQLAAHMKTKHPDYNVDVKRKPGRPRKEHPSAD